MKRLLLVLLTLALLLAACQPSPTAPPLAAEPDEAYYEPEPEPLPEPEPELEPDPEPEPDPQSEPEPDDPTAIIVYIPGVGADPAHMPPAAHSGAMPAEPPAALPDGMSGTPLVLQMPQG